MRRCRYIFLLFLSLVSFFFSSKTTALAQGEFKTNYNILYEILPEGKTQVVQSVQLTNQKTNYYPTEFEISLGKIEIDDVKAYDNQGLLNLRVIKKDDTTLVKVFFTQKVVGLGKSLNWTLYYTTSDLVTQNGLIKEVSLPRLKPDQDTENYNIQVKPPSSYGKALYIKPVFKNSLSFNKEDLIRGQVVIAFGQSQVLNFTLTYHVKNNRITPGIYEISLPPDTSYQKVYLKEIIPRPLTVESDKEGNWQAKYSLAPQEEKKITVNGSVELFLEPMNKEENTNFGALGNKYLESQKFWETNNPKIKELAKNLATVEKIYQYVVSKLRYSYDRVSNAPSRLGAAYALEHPEEAICTEFTDLFIALSRAAGIPAREVNGYAITDNSKLKPLSLQKDVLHSWPEYYDEQKRIWIPVDPTWENTTGGVDFFHTFDLNHFTFIRRGINSEYPIPAGAYKTNSLPTKDVEISFGKMEDLIVENNILLSIDAPDSIYSGLNQEGSIIVENTGSASTRLENIQISVGNGNLIRIDEQEPALLPPFGKKNIKFSFKSNSFYANQDVILSTSYKKVTVEKIAKTRTFPTIYFLPFLIILLFLALGVLIFYVTKWKK